MTDIWENSNKRSPCHGGFLSFPVMFVYSWFTLAYENFNLVLHLCVFTVSPSKFIQFISNHTPDLPRRFIILVLDNTISSSLKTLAS